MQAAEQPGAGRIGCVNVTWLLPPAILGFGVGILMMLGGRLLDAVDELARSVRRTQRVEDALIPVRVETRRISGSIERLSRR